MRVEHGVGTHGVCAGAWGAALEPRNVYVHTFVQARGAVVRLRRLVRGRMGRGGGLRSGCAHAQAQPRGERHGACTRAGTWGAADLWSGLHRCVHRRRLVKHGVGNRCMGVRVHARRRVECGVRRELRRGCAHAQAQARGAPRGGAMEQVAQARAQARGARRREPQGVCAQARGARRVSLDA